MRPLTRRPRPFPPASEVPGASAAGRLRDGALTLKAGCRRGGKSLQRGACVLRSGWARVLAPDPSPPSSHGRGHLQSAFRGVPEAVASGLAARVEAGPAVCQSTGKGSGELHTSPAAKAFLARCEGRESGERAQHVPTAAPAGRPRPAGCVKQCRPGPVAAVLPRPSPHRHGGTSTGESSGETDLPHHRRAAK